MTSEIQVISSHSSPVIPGLVKGEGSARALVWPGMGARKRSLHFIQLMPGGQTCHLRHHSEAVYYVIKGKVTTTDLGTNQTQEAVAGAMIFIEPDTAYVLHSAVSSDVVGGPCPPDLSLYEGMANQ